MEDGVDVPGGTKIVGNPGLIWWDSFAGSREPDPFFYCATLQRNGLELSQVTMFHFPRAGGSDKC